MVGGISQNLLPTQKMIFELTNVADFFSEIDYLMTKIKAKKGQLKKKLNWNVIKTNSCTPKSLKNSNYTTWNLIETYPYQDFVVQQHEERQI